TPHRSKVPTDRDEIAKALALVLPPQGGYGVLIPVKVDYALRKPRSAQQPDAGMCPKDTTDVLATFYVPPTYLSLKDRPAPIAGQSLRTGGCAAAPVSACQGVEKALCAHKWATLQPVKNVAAPA